MAEEIHKVMATMISESFKTTNFYQTSIKVENYIQNLPKYVPKVFVIENKSFVLLENINAKTFEH